MRHTVSHKPLFPKGLLLFLRVGATCRECLLHRILQRYCTGFCSAFPDGCFGRFLKIRVRDLEIVLQRDLGSIAKPSGDHMQRKLTSQLRLS